MVELRDMLFVRLSSGVSKGVRTIYTVSHLMGQGKKTFFFVHFFLLSFILLFESQLSSYSLHF